MLNKITSTILRALVMGGIIISLTTSARADHTGSPTSFFVAGPAVTAICAPSSIAYKTGVDTMKTEFGEIPEVMVPLLDKDFILVIFASPEPPYTWTAFVLNKTGCLTELRYLHGESWPVKTRAKKNAEVAR